MTSKFDTYCMAHLVEAAGLDRNKWQGEVMELLEEQRRPASGHCPRCTNH